MRAIKQLLIVLLVTTGGFALSVGLFVVISRGFFNPWRRLPDPPAQVTAFAGVDLNQIYVQTAEGFFLCQTTDDAGWVWTPTAWPVETNNFIGCGDFERAGFGLLLVMPLPHRVAAHVEAAACMRDISWYEIYALTTSGDVWMWRHEYEEDAWFSLLLNTVFLGTAAAFIVGLLLLPRAKAETPVRPRP